MSIKVGKFKGEAIRYKDGVGCCIWELLGEDIDGGICFDYSLEDTDNIIELLKELKRIDPEVYIESEESEEQ